MEVDSVAVVRLVAASAFLHSSFSTWSDLDLFAISRTFLLQLANIRNLFRPKHTWLALLSFAAALGTLEQKPIPLVYNFSIFI